MNLLLDKIFPTSNPEGHHLIRSLDVPEGVDDLKSYYEGYSKALDDILEILGRYHTSARNTLLIRLNNIHDDY